MKRILVMVCMGWVIMFVGLADHALGQMMSVQVKNGQLRSSPSFMGKVVVNLKYGDRVFVSDEKGAWVQVELDDEKTRGWIHTSALTIKKISFKAGAEIAKKSVRSNEMALGGKAMGAGGTGIVMVAGKGFNQHTEAEFRKRNPDLDFTRIDKMSTHDVPAKEMQQFLKKGALRPEGGK